MLFNAVADHYHWSVYWVA